MTGGNDIRPGTPRAHSDEKLPLCCRAWIVEQTRRQETTAPARLLEGSRIRAVRASGPTAGEYVSPHGREQSTPGQPATA
jgi:hypothetical protein